MKFTTLSLLSLASAVLASNHGYGTDAVIDGNLGIQTHTEAIDEVVARDHPILVSDPASAPAPHTGTVANAGYGNGNPQYVEAGKGDSAHVPVETPMIHKNSPPAMDHKAAIVTKVPAAHKTAAALVAGSVHTVIVGGSGLIYNPSEVKAAIGDTVHFIMLAMNHTVTQSTFDKPCVRNPAGKDSGFLPNPTNGTASAPTFNFTVDALEPTWWYCRQRQPVPHCGSGMVFAVNPTAEKAFAIFKEEAIKKNGTAAAKPTAPANTSAAATPIDGVTLSVDNDGVELSTSAEHVGLAPPAPTYTAISPGWNAGADAKACNCACFCGVGSFPDGDGVGSYGGYAGSLPAPW